VHHPRRVPAPGWIPWHLRHVGRERDGEWEWCVDALGKEAEAAFPLALGVELIESGGWGPLRRREPQEGLRLSRGSANPSLGVKLYPCISHPTYGISGSDAAPASRGCTDHEPARRGPERQPKPKPGEESK